MAYTNEEILGAIDLCVDALKKQIPKKPTRPDCYALHCPTCNNIVFDFNVERQDYCSKCGQVIDWE